MTEQDEPRPEDETPQDAPQEPAAEADEPTPEGDAPAPEGEEPTPAEPAPEEPAPEEPTREEPDEVVATAADESTADAQPDAGEDATAAEPPPDVPAEAETADAVGDDAPAEAEAPAPERQRGGRRDRGESEKREPETIPGAHLEPDLVLDESPSRGEYGERSAAEIEAAEASFGSDDGETADGAVGSEPAPVPTSVLELAADARYRATGKRKNAVARVTLLPGTGVYTINGRELDRFFPRPTLQRIARGPLETVGHEGRMDVVATIHGGGVSGQAGALRHGVARALVEADPALRSELKRHGFLTRDPRVKERKKAGLKKARKRPQFSKR